MKSLQVMCVARSPFIVDALAVCLSYCPPVLQPVGRLHLGGGEGNPRSPVEVRGVSCGQTIDLVVAAIGGRDLDAFGAMLAAMPGARPKDASVAFDVHKGCSPVGTGGIGVAQGGIPYGLVVLDRTVSAALMERGGWDGLCGYSPVFRCTTKGGFGSVCAEVLRFSASASPALDSAFAGRCSIGMSGHFQDADGSPAQLEGVHDDAVRFSASEACMEGTAVHVEVGCSSCAPFQLLTGRELEVIQGVARGLTAREIARELGISHHTVNCHRRNLYLKTGMGSVQELAVFAMNHHLVE